MKILNYYKLSLTVLFACLFYKQSAGLNILLFTSILITGLFCLKNKQTNHPLYVYFLFALSACSVCIYGNLLSIVSCMLMFIVLAGKVVFQQKSIAFSILPGLVNFSTAFPVSLYKTLTNKKISGSGTYGDTLLIRIFRTVLICLVLFVFFVLYLNSSSGFTFLVDSIKIEFPKFNFWLMLLIGAFISHAVYHHATRSLFNFTVTHKNENQTICLSKDNSGLKSRFSSGTTLFIALNILTGIVLVSDLSFLLSNTISQNNPSFYSQIVHEGVWSLIISVILALILLFIFFEGRFNFPPGNKISRRCAYVWIIFNSLLVLVTVYKNGLYISELGMTYKRIGVWYYLIASVIGLCFMYIKIKKYKNFLYMIRKTISIFIPLLVVSSFVPWEIAVTKYNISRAEKKGITPDIVYLLNLEGNNLHLLQTYAGNVKSNHQKYDTTVLNLDQRIQLYRKRVMQKDFRSFVCIEQVSINQLK